MQTCSLDGCTLPSAPRRRTQGASNGSTIYATPRRGSDATSLLRASSSRLPTFSGGATPPSGLAAASGASRLPAAPGSARGTGVRGGSTPSAGLATPQMMMPAAAGAGSGWRCGQAHMSPPIRGVLRPRSNPTRASLPLHCPITDAAAAATAHAAAEAAAAKDSAAKAEAALQAERGERARLQEALAQLQEQQAQLRGQLQASEEQLQAIQAAGGAALQEARAQVAELQRRLDDERCGNLATSTTSELMRTVRGRRRRRRRGGARQQASASCRRGHGRHRQQPADLALHARTPCPLRTQALSQNMTSHAQLQMQVNELARELTNVQVGG
jgi:hypothetical protein